MSLYKMAGVVLGAVSLVACLSPGPETSPWLLPDGERPPAPVEPPQPWELCNDRTNGNPCLWAIYCDASHEDFACCWSANGETFLEGSCYMDVAPVGFDCSPSVGGGVGKCNAQAQCM